MEKENCIQINLLVSTSDTNVLQNLEDAQNELVEYFGNRNSKKNSASLVIVNHSLTENDKQTVYKICINKNILCVFIPLEEFAYNIYTPKEES